MQLPDFLTEDAYGFIRFAGHRIGLRHVVDLYNERYTPEMLHDHFPTLALPLIHKGIAFYLEHQGEVDAVIARSRASLERQAAEGQTSPDAAELRRRMEARHPKESA